MQRGIRAGTITVDGQAAKAHRKLRGGERVVATFASLPSPSRGIPPAPEELPLQVVYEDPDLLVVNKPSGVAVHGGSGVAAGVIEALRAARPEETLELVHRLDRDTSGCLLIARKRATLRSLHALLREDSAGGGDGFDKRYLVLVRGKWELGRKRIEAPLRTDIRVGGERTVKVDAAGKQAASEFRVVQFFGNLATLLEVRLLTGRTHQIRVHAAYAGHPVAGDEKYGEADFNRQLRDFGLKRLFLHAHSISFEDPDGRGLVSVSAPLPAELHAVVDALAARAGKLRPAGNARAGVASERVLRPQRRAGAGPRTARSAAAPPGRSGRGSGSTRTGSRRGPRT